MFLIKPIIRDWLEVIISSLIIVFFVKSFLFTTYIVPTGSMIPFIEKDNRIIVNRLDKTPELGDIIAFDYPGERKVRMVKRVVGVAGDIIEVKENSLFVNGTFLKKNKFIKFIMIDPTTLDYVYKTTVPEGMVYALGDNSGNSNDSRYWGFVPEKNIIGKVKIIYWPLSKFKWIH